MPTTPYKVVISVTEASAQISRKDWQYSTGEQALSLVLARGLDDVHDFTPRRSRFVRVWFIGV